MIDHIYCTCVADRIASLNGRVTKRREKVRLSSSGGSNQHGTAVLLDEVAVEQPHDRGLGDSLGELEVVFSQSFWLGQPRFTHPPLESSLLTGGLFHSDQYRQDLQKGAAFASCFIQNLAIALGDHQKLQLSQVTVEPCLQIVISSCHENPRQWCYRNGRRRKDRRAPIRSRQSIRAAWDCVELAWEVAGAGVPPTRGSRHTRRRRSPAPEPERWRRAARPCHKAAPNRAGDAGGRRSSPAAS